MINLVTILEIRSVSSKTDSTNYSYQLYKITQIIHDANPSYRFNYLPARFHENLLRSTKFTLEEKKSSYEETKNSSQKINLINEFIRKKTIQKFEKQCMHCMRNTLIPYENKYSSVACGYNVIKQKNNISKISRKKQ